MLAGVAVILRLMGSTCGKAMLDVLFDTILTKCRFELIDE